MAASAYHIAGGGTMPTIPYNRLAAVRYARKWALSRNPTYYNFDEIGGDCTNFASQCIFAGAGVMNFEPVYGWYYISPDERSPSWTGVDFLYNFLTTNKGRGPFGREVGQGLLQIGDIIQLGREDGRFYHSLVAVSTYPEILIAAHTDDYLERPLTSYTFDKIRYIHIDGVWL